MNRNKAAEIRLNKLTAVLGLGLELVWIFSVQGLEIFAGSGPIQPEVESFCGPGPIFVPNIQLY